MIKKNHKNVCQYEKKKSASFYIDMCVYLCIDFAEESLKRRDECCLSLNLAETFPTLEFTPIPTSSSVQPQSNPRPPATLAAQVEHFNPSTFTRCFCLYCIKKNEHNT